MKKKFYLIVLPLALLLVACGPKNPLIGKWESEPMMGITSSMEFKSGSMSGGASMGGISNQGSEISISEYKVEKERVGVVVKQDGQTATVWYTIVDADTVVQDMGLVKMRFHRKK